MNLLKDDLNKPDWNNARKIEEIEDSLENDISMNEKNRKRERTRQEETRRFCLNPQNEQII